jgi:DivIVA domain-containing protein
MEGLDDQEGCPVSTGFELPGDERPDEPRPTFGSVRRGYDPKEVDAFLAQVASSIRSLEARSRQAARDAPEDDDDRLAERFARILAVQEQETETLLRQAHAEASEMAAEAKRDADRIRSAAQDAAERGIAEAGAFRERATEEADQVRSNLVERRRAMVEELPRIQARLLTFLEEIEVTLGAMGTDPGGTGGSAGGEVDDEPTAAT